MSEYDGWWSRVHQSEMWTDREGVRHYVDQMDPSHRENLRRWLDRNVKPICQAAMWETVRLFAGAPDEVQDEVDREFDQMVDNPEEWLHSTPLYVELVRLRDLAKLPLANEIRRRIRNTTYPLRRRLQGSTPGRWR